ncbi:hypothetical protein P3W45_001286 [Vairimorpha bombi]|jgi:hypothetical protein
MKNTKSKYIQHIAKSLGLYNFTTQSIINITLEPSRIQKSKYESIKNIQKDLNILYYNLAEDLLSYEFTDPLYKFLRSIYLEKRSKNVSEIKAYFIRSDYLLDNDQYKQVEINTISQCFVMFGPSLNRLHSLFNPSTLLSDTDTKFVDFLIKLKTVYDIQKKTSRSVIAMVDVCTDQMTSNYMEKVQIIHALLLKGITLKFVTIDELEIKDGDIVYSDSDRVSIIYYRWFYNYDHFTDESKELRRRLELSNVINLPSVEFQMINSKHFQVVLADKNKLAMYTDKPDKISAFFGEFIATKQEFEERSNDKYFDPKMWLSKSVSEGGNSINKNDKDSVFMKKFVSPTVDNSYVLDQIDRKIINEVSIFGSLISVDGDIIHNSEDGYIVRSKDESKLEGGICSGNGALDSIELI